MAHEGSPDVLAPCRMCPNKVPQYIQFYVLCVGRVEKKKLGVKKNPSSCRVLRAVCWSGTRHFLFYNFNLFPFLVHELHDPPHPLQVDGLPPVALVAEAQRPAELVGESLAVHHVQDKEEVLKKKGETSILYSMCIKKMGKYGEKKH